jgi:drug/metabolite transporter (DMT)-like permease
MDAFARGPAGTAVALLYIFLWASAYVPSKIATLECDPLWFLVARFLTAGVLLGAIALVLRRPFPRSRHAVLVACALGVFSNVCFLGLTYLALRHLSAGVGAIVASTNPLVLALVAPAALGERLSWPKGAGIVLGFVGVLAIVLGRGGTGSAAPADVVLAFGGVCGSVVSTIVFKRFATNEGLIGLSALQLCAAGVVMVPLAALVGGAPHHVRFTPELIASFVYLVVALSVGATLMWFWLLTHGEASRVTAYYYLTPAFGLALAALLVHEPIHGGDAFGLVAIAGGIVLAQRSAN